MKGKRVVMGIVAGLAASIATSAWAGSDTQSAWKIGTTQNPVEQTTVHTASTVVNAGEHRYKLRFSCQSPSKSGKKPLLKIRLIGLKSDNSGSIFNLDGMTRAIDRSVSIATRVRIGHMAAANERWTVSRTYGNEATVHFGPYATLGDDDRFPGPIAIAQLVKTAKAHGVMAVSGFYQGDPLVVHLADQSDPNTFTTFLSSCPATKPSLAAAAKRAPIEAYLKEYQTYLDTLSPLKYQGKHGYEKGAIGHRYIYPTITPDGKTHDVQTIGPDYRSAVDDALKDLAEHFKGPKFPKTLKPKKLEIRIAIVYKIEPKQSISFHATHIGTDESYWKSSGN